MHTAIAQIDTALTRLETELEAGLDDLARNVTRLTPGEAARRLGPAICELRAALAALSGPAPPEAGYEEEGRDPMQQGKTAPAGLGVSKTAPDVEKKCNR
jgi:hypothetical protein